MAGKPNPTKNRGNDSYIVYVIYKGNSANADMSNVWKYGISKVGESRAKSQLPRCNGYLLPDSRGRGSCGYTVLHRDVPGKLAARQLERGYISAYLGRYGHCPPGHRGRVCT